MIDLGAFRFLAPAWLLLLPAFWWLVWLVASHNLKPSMWRKICDAHLLEKMQSDKRSSRDQRWITWPLVMVLTLTVFAAAGPSWRLQALPIMESASARIIALDLSRTMLVTDVKPNRFAQALAAAREIITADFEGETGLVVFAGAAFVVSPLSRDANTLLAFIDALEPSVMPVDGSRIDLAIGFAQGLLEASITTRGQIIVITAGTDDSTNAIQAAQTARAHGHQVSILAIGTAAGAPLVDARGGLQRDGNGNFVLSRTNLPHLQRIAGAGNGVLVTLSRSSAYNDLLLSRLKARELVKSEHAAEITQRSAANDGVWLIWLILPFALLLFRRNLLWVILLLVVLPGDRGLYAGELNSLWQHPEKMAFAAFVEGDYELARDLSSDAMLKGSAYYRSGLYAQALEFFSRDDSAYSFYNRGNAYAAQKMFAEAIAAYAQAIELNPGFENARYNKRLIDLFLEQQTESAGLQPDNSDSELASTEHAEQADFENRLGVIGQDSTNPGDEQQQGPGMGASMQGGQVDPFERFDGSEENPERFSLGDNIAEPRAQAIVERWLKNLPEASTELFRRKFQRDYQRQRRRAR